MRTIIAGSRDFTDPTLVHAAIAASGFTITHVLSGGARGIDLAGEAWATAHAVPVTVLPAEWDRFGKGAGYRRNEAMAAQADALLAVWDKNRQGLPIWWTLPPAGDSRCLCSARSPTRCCWRPRS